MNYPVFSIFENSTKKKYSELIALQLLNYLAFKSFDFERTRLNEPFVYLNHHTNMWSCLVHKNELKWFLE
jgi:hypothetical protein